ncbi:(2Fe-2S) ferredoxin domain-containing protein, partial [Bacillus sp. JJ634]
CNGRCHDKCVVIAYPNGTWYKDMKPEDSPLLIDSLLSNKDCTGKISHTFNGEEFERSEGTVAGVRKNKAKVNKVSKIL